MHGWDVGRATGADPEIPEDLARALMPVAQAVVLPEDRPERFAAPRRTGQTAGFGRRAARIPGPLLIRPVGPGIHIWDKVPPNPSP